MRATTLWVVFTLFIVIYQATALPLAPHKEAEEKEKTPEVQKQEVKEDKEKDEKVQDDDKDSEDDGSADDEDEQENEGVDNNDEDGSASADKQDDDDDSKERNQRSAEESGEAPTKAVATKKKSAAGKRCCGCCGCCNHGCGCGCGGGSWGVCDLCHHPRGDGWCGAGCQCANCCGGFGHPITNHGCNGGCCPSVTFPCSFGACVNNPCCECCREPAPPGKCKWPCLWPCCCECTPPKFKFKPLKPKPVCHCPHSCGCGSHKRSEIPTHRIAPFAPAYVPAHPYGAYSPRAFIPYAPAPYYGGYGPVYHY